MTPQRAVVTYAASPVFLSTDQWKQVHAALLAQLPLRTLHWKSTSRPTIRTVQELDVNLVTLETLRDEHTSQIPQTLLEKPLLNIYFVACEDTETYKNTIRRQIKDWHTSVSQRKNQEWLIVHIVRPDGRAAQGRIFQMKASVLDKIKADFNIDKKDRCVQLLWSTDYENPTAWADFMNKLKEGILSAFDSALTQREEEVRRSEGQRQMPGWNFCTFFVLKESLAISFEGMNMYEEALQQYDELEASFFQVLREKNLSWFGVLISPSPQDDSTPLLSVTKKPYRDLILANSISVFDFRVYLLARQCVLLSKLGGIVEIGRKAVAFLNGFGRRLREVEDTLPPFFVESWTYSSALSVVDQCDSWASPLGPGKATLASFNATKGELLELARHQLDIIGIRVGHLPSRPPFSIALPAPLPSPSMKMPRKRASHKISRTELLSALNDKETFYDLYVQVTNRAIELYAIAGRRKFALKLHGNLAALDVFRGRLPNALETFKSLPAHYAPHGWTSLESFMRTQALAVHASTEKAKDGEWIHILLEFLRVYVADMGRELLADVDDHNSFISALICSLKDATRGLQSDLLYSDHPAISVVVSNSEARLAGSQDGALLDVYVNNRLPCEVPIDDIIVRLVGREGIQLSFTANVASLRPGSNMLTLFCPSSTLGTYACQLSQIKMSRLIFEWKAPNVPPTTKNLRVKELPRLVKIPKDLQALDVCLRQPQRIEIGTAPRVMVILRTGRNDVSRASLRLSAPSGIQFKFTETTFHGEGYGTLQATDESITLFDIGKEKTVVISLPHSDASVYHFMRVNITIEYVTAPDPRLTRALKLTKVVATSLPVAINVEDFFRGTRLFTRFTLSTTSHQHIRIRSTHLRHSKQDPDGIKITECVLQKPAITTVTPTQPGKFLFQLDSMRGRSREPLHLQITYRVLREEVESLIDVAVGELITHLPSLRPHRDVLIDKLVQALESNAKWVELYNVTGELMVPEIPDEEGEIGMGLNRLKEIMGRRGAGDLSYGQWREIVIPVDVPQTHILAAACLRILHNAFSTETSSSRLFPLFAGQPISAVVTVTTSFHWAPLEDTNASRYWLRYDVEDMTQDWLVSGRKRGEFLAKVRAPDLCSGS
ncbi:hypothetical protein AcW1_005812 [Taiwanofungus camphoratus]|nr:hypothetical protein AcW1_005812 [Antrodia cinnamomea]